MVKDDADEGAYPIDADLDGKCIVDEAGRAIRYPSHEVAVREKPSDPRSKVRFQLIIPGVTSLS